MDINRIKSRMEIQANLQKKGFSKDEIQHILQENVTWDDEFASATNLFE